MSSSRRLKRLRQQSLKIVHLKEGIKGCDFAGCTSQGVWNPVLVCPQPNTRPTRLEMGLSVCDDHRRVPVEGYLPDSTWSKIRPLLIKEGRVAVRNKISIEFESDAGLVYVPT